MIVHRCLRVIRAPSPASLVIVLLFAGCFRTHAPRPDTSGCFQGAYPSAPSELRRAMLPAPALVTTQLAGLHIMVRDARRADVPLPNAYVWLVDDAFSSRQRLGLDARLTVTTLQPVETQIRVRGGYFEHLVEMVPVRAGYIDTLVFRPGYLGNECYIVPQR
jgi:hypothetical protein